MIKVSDLSLKSILRNINFQLSPHKLLVVIGPNGAGKSTLLKLISGLVKPCSGNILLNNQDLKDFPLKEKARLMSFLPQHIEMAFDFKVNDIVSMGTYPLFLTKKQKKN